MRTELKIFVLILFSSIIISCENESEVSNIITNPPTVIDSAFKYPYKLNSFWYYTTRNFITNLRPDSIGVYFSADTLTGYGAANYVKDTIINLDTLRLLRNAHSETGHSHTTLELFRQTDSGLIRIAYYSDGLNFGPFRHVNNLRFSFGGKTYNSLNELKGNTNYDFISSDTNTLYFDNPPVTLLKYPVSQNTEWNFINYGTTRITKKYTAFENVTVPAGTFYCIKIKRDVYYNSSTPDPNYFYYDYFSKDGMIKRDFTLKDILVSNNFGQIIGYIDVKEEAFLNIYIP